MSYARRALEMRDDDPVDDHIVQIDGATWEDYERFLDIRGERSVPRITYLEGTLELMTPSRDHETIKSIVGRLVEAYCLHADIRFTSVGSWTLRRRKEERGAEPDECYLFGDGKADVPDLAIEVIWTSGRLDKLEVYRRLGVREVWIWRKGVLRPYGLAGDQYEPLDRSRVLPGIDLDLLVGFLDRPSTYDAIRDYRAALQRR
jgi:Uma2 family endonuclease